MGFLGDLGVEGGFFGNFSGQTFMFWAGLVFLFVILLIVTAVITFIFVSKKAKKLSYKNQIPIFTTINGKHHRLGLDWAKELFVPDSNISLFFLKKHKIYLARPTRAMGKNEYWYSISENGEWVNFNMSTDPKHNTLAQANYDHRDTRYAYINLKEIIKKNYKDKALVWWKDPVVMNIIAFIIMCMVFLGGVWFIVSKLGGAISSLGPFTERLEIIADKMAGAVKNAQNINSGITPA